jgi:Methyltransferase domain
MRSAVWDDEGHLRVDGVLFVPSPPGAGRFSSSSTRFCLVKRPELVRDHLGMLAELRPSVVVELGLMEGGSTALMALVAEPEKLVALELSAPRSDGLTDLISERGLDDRVEVHYGIDQSDVDRLTSAIDSSLGDRPIDLVVDDASHLLGPTRASFNVLFPRLRPGGWFVIEDWSWAHIGFGLHQPAEVPLTTVVFELVMALPSTPGLIREIRVTRDWAVVVRGDKDLDRTSFDLSSQYSERGRNLVVPLVASSAD